MRLYLRYLFVLATVHYDVLSDGQYRLDVSKAPRRLMGLVGGFDCLELERERRGLGAEVGFPCFCA